MMPRYLTVFWVCLSLWLTACSPSEQPFLPQTGETRLKESHIQLADGTELPLRIWSASGAEQPKAIIIGLHGFNDYSNAFDAPAQFFNNHGITVIAYDQRGFGRTYTHGIWAGRQNLVSDLRQLITAVHAQYPDTPLYVLGESMGGAVAIVTLSQPDFPSDMVQGAILSAPAVWGDETMNGFYRMTLWLMAHTIPGREMSGSDLKIQASDNIEMLRALSRDPLVIKQTRVDAVYGIVRLMDEAYIDAPKLKMPLLLMYGANDQIIPPEPIFRTVRKLRGLHTVAFIPMAITCCCVI